MSVDQMQCGTKLSKKKSDLRAQRRRWPTVGIGDIYWKYLRGVSFHAFVPSGP